MAKKIKKDERELIHVEILIRLEGSIIENRMTVFEMPIEGRDEATGAVNIETKTLINKMKTALDGLR
jgi:hypothetical protein